MGCVVWAKHTKYISHGLARQISIKFDIEISVESCLVDLFSFVSVHYYHYYYCYSYYL